MTDRKQGARGGGFKRPRLIIMGYARHGKDTVAELLRDRHGMRFQSSSRFCAERVMMPFFRSIGRPYPTVEECFQDRAKHRETWYDQISRYNEGDSSRLARELFAAGNDVYVGMRSETELKGARECADLVVWVDALERLPPEPRSSCTVSRRMADVCIANNGSKEELVAAVDAFAMRFLQPEVARALAERRAGSSSANAAAPPYGEDFKRRAGMVAEAMKATGFTAEEIIGILLALERDRRDLPRAPALERSLLDAWLVAVGDTPGPAGIKTASPAGAPA